MANLSLGQHVNSVIRRGELYSCPFGLIAPIIEPPYAIFCVDIIVIPNETKTEQNISRLLEKQ